MWNFAAPDMGRNFAARELLLLASTPGINEELIVYENWKADWTSGRPFLHFSLFRSMALKR
jgi:hypothetical protein